MRSLILETCTKRAIVALVEDGHLRYTAALPFGYSSSRYLIVKVDEALRSLNIETKDLDRIVTGVGPGSFTGMRVGAAVAKTLSYVHKIPLVGLSTLYTFVPEHDGPFGSLIDANMGGVYFCTGVKEGNKLKRLTEPSKCSLDDISKYLTDISVIVTPDSSRLQGKLSEIQPDSANWEWQESTPDPMIMYQYSEDLFNQGSFTTDGSLELIYLRNL